MKAKYIFEWFYHWIHNYNLFIPDEDEYDDNSQPTDPEISLKYQRYTTRLYVFLLAAFLYILFLIALILPQTGVVIIEHITPDIFVKLQAEHGETLSCPCSTTIIPYKDFVTNTVFYHPICSSIFVDERWIRALYLSYSSTFLVVDFRTTASFQFKLLAALCSLSTRTVTQTLTELDSTQLITIQLLSESNVRSQIIGNVELLRSTASPQITSPLSFLQITTQANSLISALNTNLIARATFGRPPLASATPTAYHNPNDPDGRYLISLCGLINPVAPAGFYSSLSFYESADNHKYWPDYSPAFEPVASSMVNGFFGGCTPLDAILASTFDCLYNTTCLEVFANYFPDLNQTNFNWSVPLAFSNRKKVPLNILLTDLFVEEWSTEINYFTYFLKCSSKFCTYTETNQANVAYTITLLISLYGGLTIILRLISNYLINISLKVERRKFLTWIKQLNLFKLANERTDEDIEQQRIITRVYFILLTGSIIILILFTSLDTHFSSIFVQNPSIRQYKHLQESYSTSLSCPCRNVSMPYITFTSLSPTLHQVCSSDFITDSWIIVASSIKSDLFRFLYIDWIWRGLDGRHFQLLAILCKLAKQTIDDSVYRFTRRLFVTSNVLSETEFNIQVNTTFEQFVQSLLIQFELLINTTHLFTQVDQPFTNLDNAKLVGKPLTSDQFTFDFTGVSNTNSTSVECICATNPNCQSGIALYGWNGTRNDDIRKSLPYFVPGVIEGCFVFDTLLLSTLECFYLDSCLAVYRYYLYVSVNLVEAGVEWVDVHPLSDQQPSRFTRNTSLSMIVKEIMVEEWNSSFSFGSYYNVCAPSYCTYTDKIHTYSLTGIIIKLVSMIGGLTVVLRLLTPALVKFVIHLIKPKVKRQVQVHSKLSTRIRILLRKAIAFLYVKSVNLNLFPVRTFGCSVDRIQAKHLGRFATRLYIILLVICIAILGLYTIVQPQILTKTFVKPSLNQYNQLVVEHPDTLSCPCSTISSPYERFIKIKPEFHQICSNSFALDQWRTDVLSNLDADLSTYALLDYRRFLSAHLQLLTGLCELSIQSVNDAIVRFLSSNFITAQLMSQSIFDTNIQLLIEQSKSDAPIALKRFLDLLREANQGNAIISAYNTNFQYIAPYYTYDTFNAPLITQATIYDDNCSCALDGNCTIPAVFILTDSSQNISIQGLKMGCTPSESFLGSTLECFYQSLCINLFQQVINNVVPNNITNMSPPLLSVDNSRFLMNTSVHDLVNNLFIENWSTVINYSTYFDQCSPILCSYTYIQKLNSLYTITLLLGLYGGLTLILKRICPKIIYLTYKVHKRRKNKNSSIQPIDNVGMTTIHTSISTIPPSRTKLRSTMFSFLLFGIILSIIISATAVVPAVYLNRQRKNPVQLSQIPMGPTAYTTSGMNVSTTTVSSSAVTCNFTFKKLISYSTGDLTNAIVVADFNRDHHPDLVFLHYFTGSIGILFGNDDGTFQEPFMYSTETISQVGSLLTDDFNNDGRLDLAFASYRGFNIGVLFGNDDGSFGSLMTYSDETETSDSSNLAVGDFDNDNHLDLIIVNYWGDDRIRLLRGSANGTFIAQTGTNPSICEGTSFIAVGDFNNDGQLDLIVTDHYTGHMCVLFGNGTGYFGESVSFLTDFYNSKVPIVVNDFNNDSQLDVVVANAGGSTIKVFLGNDNGTLKEEMEYSTGRYARPGMLVTGDYNTDGRLDIAFGNTGIPNVGVLFGRGNGTFFGRTTFSTVTRSISSAMASSDFNSDGKLDLAIVEGSQHNVTILLNTCDS
ncbi:unnamed protein product [Adineta ricciae]|uniref:Uncharacterized protein n=1 Tax=Adineta ricciae TaxID=249248 RepID=A0A814W6E7_ADIRI|nr:unnamed protein product [Adineta ricciae]